MHVPQFFRKPAFWCFAFIVLVVLAIISAFAWHYRGRLYYVWDNFDWVLMISNSPTEMERAPFWHYGEDSAQGLGAPYVIAHGGSAVENVIQTNSREALQNAKKLGFRFVEIDLQVLADGTIVGAHDAPPADLQTWEKFSAQPIKGRFTPIALPEIRDFFRSNPDMWLVTDKISKKEDLEKFLQIWGEDHGNLVVEVFSVRQWLDARKLGIRLPALNVGHGRVFDGGWELYRWELKALRFFNIPVATCCSQQVMKKYPKEAEEYLKAGGSLLVFTENDVATVRQNLSRRATLFYTDYLSPAESSSEPPPDLPDPNSSASGISVGNGSAESENKSAFSL